MRGIVPAVSFAVAASACAGCGSFGNAADDVTDGCVAIVPAPFDSTAPDASFPDVTDAADGIATEAEVASAHPDAISRLDSSPPPCRSSVGPIGACGAGLCVPAARTLVPHVGADVALLGDGRVLVVGGDPYRTFAEIYSPACDLWSLATPSSMGHGGEVSQTHGIPLDDGRALFVGGYGSSLGYEIFDPAHDTWSSVRPVPDLRGWSGASTRLADGRWLFAEWDGRTLEAYDATKDAWTRVPSGALPAGFSLEALATLTDGRVFVVGVNFVPGDGGSEVAINHAFLLEPSTDEWTETAPPPGDISTTMSGPLLALPDGRAVVFSLHESWIFDPVDESWAAVSARGGSFGTATLLPCGKIMFLGDYDAYVPGWRAVWDPESDVTTPMPIPRPMMANKAVVLHDGSVLSVGGLALAGAYHPRISAELCR